MTDYQCYSNDIREITKSLKELQLEENNSSWNKSSMQMAKEELQRLISKREKSENCEEKELYKKQIKDLSELNELYKVFLEEYYSRSNNKKLASLFNSLKNEIREWRDISDEYEKIKKLLVDNSIVWDYNYLSLLELQEEEIISINKEFWVNIIVSYWEHWEEELFFENSNWENIELSDYSIVQIRFLSEKIQELREKYDAYDIYVDRDTFFEEILSINHKRNHIFNIYIKYNNFLDKFSFFRNPFISIDEMKKYFSNNSSTLYDTSLELLELLKELK